MPRVDVYKFGCPSCGEEVRNPIVAYSIDRNCDRCGKRLECLTSNRILCWGVCTVCYITRFLILGP